MQLPGSLTTLTVSWANSRVNSWIVTHTCLDQHICLLPPQLPDSLTTLTNLRVLGLTSNRLWQLPPGIAGCSSLRVLDCSHNLLSRLPAGMGSMARLRSVKLTHNKLGWVPVWEFQELPGLKELHLAGNGFTVRQE